MLTIRFDRAETLACQPCVAQQASQSCQRMLYYLFPAVAALLQRFITLEQIQVSIGRKNAMCTPEQANELSVGCGEVIQDHDLERLTATSLGGAR